MGRRGDSKHRRSNVKIQHHTLPGLRRLLETIGGYEEVKLVHPADIRHGAKTQGLQFRISSVHKNTIFVTARNSGAAQKIHIVSSDIPGTLRKLRLRSEFAGENNP
ncbi:hypothetical protein IT415_03515 [bacterium]|nr:hypothetical protein [bacterium]